MFFPRQDEIYNLLSKPLLDPVVQLDVPKESPDVQIALTTPLFLNIKHRLRKHRLIMATPCQASASLPMWVLRSRQNYEVPWLLPFPGHYPSDSKIDRYSEQLPFAQDLAPFHMRSNAISRGPGNLYPQFPPASHLTLHWTDPFACTYKYVCMHGMNSMFCCFCFLFFLWISQVYATE